MEATMTTIPGFDVDTMNQFAAHAAQNPEQVELGIEAKTIWEGTGGTSLAKIGPWQLAGQQIEKPSRDYSLQFGAWKEVEAAAGVESPADRLEPIEGALAAMCACVNYAICMTAAREGVAFEQLEVKAHAVIDPRVLLGALGTEHRTSVFKSVELVVTPTGDLTDAERQRIVDMAQRSPVHALIEHGCDLQTRVGQG